MKKILLILTSVLLTSCVTHLSVPEGVPEIAVSDFEELIDGKTKKVEVYDGLYNKLTVQATWIDSAVTDGTLSHNARLSQWNEQKYKEEKSKIISKHTESTEFFISFYTPEKKHADLTSNKNLWKIFLDVNGQRYEGKATRVKLLLSEIQAIYPYHNRWSTPYVISFPVATSITEGKPAVLTFTGTITSTQIQF